MTLRSVEHCLAEFLKSREESKGSGSNNVYDNGLTKYTMKDCGLK